MQMSHAIVLCNRLNCRLFYVQVQISNSAIGGITSSTASQCFDAMINPTSDLVLIEFSLNDR